MNVLPTVSVVVPVFNNSPTIERCVDSVLGQDYPTDLVEPIFVDNNSSDPSRELLERYGGRIRVLREGRRGASAARNRGLRAAVNQYVAFTDGDCIADQSWLRELVDCARENPDCDFIGGRILAFEPKTTVEQYEESIHDQRAGIEVYEPPAVATGNCLVPRASFSKFGLFDESFLRAEDAELSFRAHFHWGSRFAFAERAVVRHANRITLPALFSLGLSHGQGAARIWAHFHDELQLSRLRRCLDLRGYFAPLKPLFHGSAFRGVNPDHDPPRSPDFATCDAVFKTAKELGFLMGTIRYRSRRRSVRASKG